MKAESNSEGEFFSLLHTVLTGSKPIDALLENSNFTFIARRICSLIQGNEEGDADDLFQEACLRLWRYSGSLNIEYIQSEDHFWSWFFIVALNLKRARLRKKKLLIDATPLTEIHVADLRVNLEDDCLLSEFEAFIKTLPDQHMIALKMWLRGYSLREISEFLNQLGSPCSHVTIRSWIHQSVNDFFH